MSASLTTASPLGSQPIDHRDGARSLGLALAFLAGAAVLLGALQIIGTLTRGDVLWPVLIFTAAFWIWIAAGVILWWLRPADRTGPLLFAGGAAVFLAGQGNAGEPALAVVGAVFSTAVLAVGAHLLLALPDGRLRGVLAVVTVTLAYTVTIGLSVVRVAIPIELLDPFVIVTLVQRWLGLALLILVAALIIRRVITSPGANRRALIPVYVIGLLVLVLVPLLPTLLGPLGVAPPILGALQLALTTLLPVLFLIGGLRIPSLRDAGATPVDAGEGA